MKRIFLPVFALLSITILQAQQKEGKVIYERTAQMQVRMQGMNEEMERLITQKQDR
jgi:hypothetical protein